jgi:hypothetical protein
LGGFELGGFELGGFELGGFELGGFETGRSARTLRLVRSTRASTLASYNLPSCMGWGGGDKEEHLSSCMGVWERVGEIGVGKIGVGVGW